METTTSPESLGIQRYWYERSDGSQILYFKLDNNSVGSSGCWGWKWWWSGCDYNESMMETSVAGEQFCFLIETVVTQSSSVRKCHRTRHKDCANVNSLVSICTSYVICATGITEWRANGIHLNYLCSFLCTYNYFKTKKFFKKIKNKKTSWLLLIKGYWFFLI